MPKHKRAETEVEEASSKKQKPPEDDEIDSEVADKEESEESEGEDEEKDAPSVEDLMKKKVAELKHICRMKGLRVSGRKNELIERILNPPSVEAQSSRGGRRLTAASVHKMLKDLGVQNPEDKSNCLKRGIQRGYIILEQGLDTVVCSGKCDNCDNTFDATVEDLLEQPDYAGTDYECGGENASVNCPEEDCGLGMYVTQICEGRAQFDSGKFHNHCHKCPGFGRCINDYRNSHCDRCDRHWFKGCTSGFPCPNCESYEGGRRPDDECVIS